MGHWEYVVERRVASDVRYASRTGTCSGRIGRLLLTLFGSSCSGVSSAGGTCGTSVVTGGNSTVVVEVVAGGSGVVGTGFNSVVGGDVGDVGGDVEASDVVDSSLDDSGVGSGDVGAESESSSLHAATAIASMAMTPTRRILVHHDVEPSISRHVANTTTAAAPSEGANGNARPRPLARHTSPNGIPINNASTNAR